jgi:release factor glutamine methyltransferase
VPDEALRLIDILQRSEAFLRKRGVPQPRLDAEALIGTVLALPRLQLYLQHDRPFDSAEREAVRALVQRRGRREPLAWLTRRAGFHTLELQVDPGVLVPRPDTEALVDAALSWIGPPDEPVYVVDACCGTGCVGLALAAAHPQIRVYATDLSPEAIANTRDNVARLGLKDRVAVLQGDLLRPIPDGRPVDWVVSNPPYIPTDELAALEPEVSRWEPRLALDGGTDGHRTLARLVDQAAMRARRGLLVEIGKGTAARTAELMRRAGLHDVAHWPDLAGVQRVVGGRRPT